MAFYRMAFACVACRVSFKREARVPGFGQFPRGRYPLVKICPNCGGQALNLGRHFCPPRRRNLRQWRKVGLLLTNGFFFQKLRPPEFSTQINYPKELTELPEFLVRTRALRVTS